ncbi:MAG: YihY/virulence factor BrkB family protein [Bdellovibrio sp.]
MISQFRRSFGFNSLKEVLRDTLQQMRDGELQLVAASLAFSTAIALVPFIAVVLATFQSIAGLEAFYPKVEALLLSNMREAAGVEVTKFIRIFLKNINAGKLGTTGAILLFITSIRLLHDMEVGIHRVWNERNTRPFYKRLIYQWLLILLIPVFLAVYVGFTSLEQFKFVHRVVPAFISNSMVLVGTLFLIYKMVPHRHVRFQAALVSSILASGALYVVHKTYAALALKFFAYSKIYGSFAALPLLLLWILTLWYTILGGVALCASLQRRHVA